MNTSEEPLFDDDATGSTKSVGESIDAGKGRIFPCDQCGADLEFSIGQQSLQCPYCGAVKQLELPETEIHENDFEAMLDRLEEWKRNEHQEESATGEHEVRCESCGANVLFQGTLTSSTCPYCASPLQRDKIHDAPTRIPVDAVLPFLVPRERAAENLSEWVRTRWFAPTEFKRQGAKGKFNGCYLPYFTFDSATFTRYRGQRGDHYYVTVGSGKDQRQERRTRWTDADGQFSRFFDDVLVLALKDEHSALLRELEPWPLGKCVSYSPELLAGLFARTYDITLKDSFNAARARMEDALVAEVRQRIGGDEQRIEARKSAYNAITFKHVLLPVWLLAYRFHDKTYRVTVNAATGEVNGERPWSAWKIALFVLVCTAIVGTVVALSQH